MNLLSYMYEVFDMLCTQTFFFMQKCRNPTTLKLVIIIEYIQEKIPDASQGITSWTLIR